jgi:hypothetical protein
VIPATWEAEPGRIAVQGQPETPSQPIAGHSGVHLYFQVTWESEIRRLEVVGQ